MRMVFPFVALRKEKIPLEFTIGMFFSWSRERGGQYHGILFKQIPAPEMNMHEYICYCWHHTREDIEKDIAVNGRSTIMERIMAASKEGNCNCAEINPSGR